LGDYHCPACGLAWNDAPPPPDPAGDWESDYYSDAAIIKLHQARRSAMGAIVQRLSALHPERGRLLDVGSGLGFLMDSAARAGWAVEGVEASPTAAASARKLTGAKVTEGLMETADVPAAGFDVVTILDTLRHVPDPMALLHSAGRALRPGGLLMVREINRDIQRVGTRLLGRKSRAAQAGPRKVFEYAQRFSPKSILHALRLAGYSGCWVEPSPMFREKDSGPGTALPLLKDGAGWLCEAIYRASGKRLVVSPNLLAFGRVTPAGKLSVPGGPGRMIA
jgi:2-polyprenyl-3-methyl-5-hydroxy-6-metoxy-1,4-benzoquinol methylase